MKRNLSIWLFALVSIVVCAGTYTPQTVPNPKHTGQGNFVCNPDGIITADDETFLNRCARQLEDSTGVELCVVALDNISDYDAFDFCYELFQHWGIGKEGKNTGVLLFLALDTRDVRIMTGGGIEGVLNDAVCNQVIQKNMLPALKQGDYSGGLCLGALRIYELCTDGDAPEELRNTSSITNRYQYANSDDDPSATDWMLIAAIVIGMLGLLQFLLKHDKKCPKCGKRALHKTRSQIISTATYHHTGTGVNTYKCRYCGHTEERPFTIPKKTRTYISGGGSSFGGGFGGGFSGGSFGGGSTFGGGAGSKF